MKTLLLTFCSCLLIIGLTSCSDEKQTNVGQKKPETTVKVDTFRNVIVLIDLSSRVNLPYQDAKDRAILKQLVEVFQNSQRKYGFQISKDKLDVKIAFQQGAVTQPFEFGDDLTIDMTAPQMNKPNFDVKKSKFIDAVDKLYNQAVKSKTTGADIWNFFNSHISNYIKKPDKKYVYKNKVIILTDGYLEFDRSISSPRQKGTYFDPRYRLLRNKPNWSELFDSYNIKLKPCGTFENTEVLMLEVVPYNAIQYSNEFQILEKIWLSWFKDMKINATLRLSEDNSENLKYVLNSFLEK